MPELAEVETTRRGIVPHIEGKCVTNITVRQWQLRYPIPRKLKDLLVGQRIQHITRRGKYLLCDCGHGTLLIHLGMSGNLRIVPPGTPAEKHAHVDITFEHGKALRYTDPRRFGMVLWLTGNPYEHPLLAHLGPEPLTRAFTGKQLWSACQKRKTTIKQVIMDSKVVVGVGNIYAAEALYDAMVHPERTACELSEEECSRLVRSIKKILKRAIAKGGTTLKDFTSHEGKPGYFQQCLKVYGRDGEACGACETVICKTVTTGRSTFFCPVCQI